MPKIKVSLSINFPGITHKDVIEVDEYRWEECKGELDRSNLMEEIWKEWSNNFIDGGYELID